MPLIPGTVYVLEEDGTLSLNPEARVSLEEDRERSIPSVCRPRAPSTLSSCTIFNTPTAIPAPTLTPAPAPALIVSPDLEIIEVPSYSASPRGQQAVICSSKRQKTPLPIVLKNEIAEVINIEEAEFERPPVVAKNNLAAIINLEEVQFEEQIEREFYLPVAAAQQPELARRQRIIPIVSPIRNPPITFPLVVENLVSLQKTDMDLRSGKTVELTDGSFLKIAKIIRNVQTDEVLLRGWPLKRCTDLRGLTERMLNELCFVLQVDLDDNRDIWEQNIIERNIIDAVKIRRLVSTNFSVPHWRFSVSDLPHFETEIERKAYVRNHERLVVRWKYLTFFDNATDRAKNPLYPFHIRKKCFERLTEPECSPGCYMVALDPVKARRNGKYTFGDAFCGAGGSSSGAVAANLDLRWGLDMDQNAGKTWRSNFPDARHFEMWAHEFVTLEANSVVDVLHLSPPCQIFSPMHGREGRNDQQNFDSLFACDAIIDKAQPRIVTVEQTFGILHPKFEAALNGLIHIFTSKGYSVSWQLVQFQYYGLAQTRRRLIIIAASPGEALPKMPDYTHSENAFDRLKRMNSVQKVLDSVPRNAPNHDVQYAISRGPRGRWDASGRISTLCSDGGTKGYPDGSRTLTLRELAALQSFPHYHEFQGGYVKKQIGNAVPPIFSKALFEAIVAHLERADRAERI